MTGSPHRGARDHAPLLALVLALAAAAWIVVVRQARAMGSMPMGLTMGLGPAPFLVTWAVMMAAMMLPASAPMIAIYRTVYASRRTRGQSFVPTWVFVTGYLTVWVAAGVPAYVLARAADALATRSPWLVQNGPRFGGGMLVLAGLYQLTPLKHACLAKCRTPLQFVMTSWRDGYAGAVRMGLEHGLHCLGCCWVLFAILFPLGIMNIAVMASVTALVCAEKMLPGGARLARVAGAGLVALGALVAAAPRLLGSGMSR